MMYKAWAIILTGIVAGALSGAVVMIALVGVILPGPGPFDPHSDPAHWRCVDTITSRTGQGWTCTRIERP